MTEQTKPPIRRPAGPRNSKLADELWEELWRESAQRPKPEPFLFPPHIEVPSLWTGQRQPRTVLGRQRGVRP